MITVFSNFSNTKKPKYYPIDTVLDTIKKCTIQKQIDEIRSEKDEKKKKELKKMLPCILFSGKFTERNDKSITEHSGFVVLDWDKLQDAKAKKEEISLLPYVYSCFISPSGDGVKAVIKIPSDISKHRGYYKGLMQIFPDLDATSINESRICYASADNEIYINTIATTFDTYIKVLDAKINNSVEIKEVKFNDYGRANRALNLIRNAVDGQKHAELLKASKLMGGYIAGGLISEDEAIRLLESEIQNKNIDDFDGAKLTIRNGIKYGKSTPIEEETTLVQQVKNIKTPKVEIVDVEYLAPKNDIDDYLNKWRSGTFELGLTTGIPSLDKYFLFKRGNFNVINGFDNVGKSTGLWYLCMLSSIFHNWKWIIYSNENKAGTVVKRLIEFYYGIPITDISDTQYIKGRLFVDTHFKIISNDFLFTYKDILKIADMLSEVEKFDGLLIDPYNSLSFDYSRLGKISTHEYHYESASEMQKYAKKNDICVYLNCHVISSALREEKAPKKADTEGGGKFSNKADDFLTFHREIHSETDWNKMEIYVRKIKELETGGSYTVKNDPYILEMKRNGCSYMDKFQYDPIEVYWKNNGKQTELPISEKSAITPNINFNEERKPLVEKNWEEEVDEFNKGY